MDKYQILGLTKNATEEQVKNAYRKFAKMYHEQGTQPNSDKFNEVSTAYHEIMQEIIENKDEDYYKKRIQEISERIQEIKEKQKEYEEKLQDVNNKLKPLLDKIAIYESTILADLNALKVEITAYYNDQLEKTAFFKHKQKRTLEQAKNRYVNLIAATLEQAKDFYKKPTSENAFPFNTIFGEEDITFFKQQFKTTTEHLLSTISSYKNDYPTITATGKELVEKRNHIEEKRNELNDLYTEINERLDEEMNRYYNSKEHFRDTMEKTILSPSKEDPKKTQEKEIYLMKTEENGTNFQNQSSFEEKTYETKEEKYFRDMMDMTNLKR